MKRKFSYITIIMILGIINSYYLNNSYPGLMGLLICIFLPLIIAITNKNRLSGLSFGVIIYVLGALIVFISINGSGLYKFIGREITISGELVDKKEVDKGLSTYLVKTRSIDYNNRHFSIKEKTRIKIIDEADLELGDLIKFKVNLKEPMKNTNSKLYNFKKNLQSQRIHTIGTIRINDILEHKTNKNLVFKAKNAFRNRVIDLFISCLSRDNSQLIISIILGDYSYLEEGDVNGYRSLGLAHVLAVSGLHIGIISSFCLGVLSYLGIRRRCSSFIVIGVIWIYSFLIGCPVSTLRACIMLTIALLANLLIEPYDSINNLFISMFILLIINPLYIFSLSFQLSYLASLSLLLINPYLKERLYLIRSRALEAILPIISVQLGLLPFQIYYFNEMSLFSIIANLVLVPIVSLGLIIGFSMLFFSFIFPYINNILGFILDILLTGERTITKSFLNLPFLSLKLRSPDLWEFIIYYIMLMILLGIIDISKLSKRFQKMIIIWASIFILGINILPILDRALYLEFIDVGQGDSILIRSGWDNYLVDTGGEVLGGFKIGENITLPYLRKNGYDKIKGLFITHFHDDHSRAAPLLIEELNVDNIFASYKDEENDTYKEIERLGREVRLIGKGDSLRINKNLTIKVLSPSKDKTSSNHSDNNRSLVLLLEYFNHRILLTGDIEKEIESYLIKEKKLEDIDIIKVAHHGSKTSSTEEFLSRLRPKIAIISVGRNNLFGHPADEVIERYDRLSDEIYRTDQLGKIKIRVNRESIDIYPYIEESYLGTIDILVYLICLLNAYVIILIYLKDRERFLIGL